MLRVMTVLDNSTLCVGNPDNKFDHLIEHYKREFTDASGKSDFAKIAIMYYVKNLLMLPLGTELVGYYDEQSHPNPTIRHVECELITGSSSAGRCLQCQEYR